MNDYKIKKLYEQMELELIASMKRNLKRHLNEENKVGFHFTQWQAEKLKELKRYQRENARIIGKRTRGLNKKVSEHLQKELKQGSVKAMKQYNKLHKDKFKADKLLNKSFFQTNDAKVNNLIKVVNNDLNIVKASALRMTNDQYREVIHKSAFFNANGVMTEKQAVDMANKDFLSRGLNCIEYKDGRRVNIASYSQMAVRTASLRAQLMGEGDFRKEIGNPLVIVTTHGGACKLCTAWQDKVLIDDVYSGGTKEDGDYPLLSEAMKQGFLHPNCRHGLATYYPELEGIKYDEEETDEEIDDALRDKLNYYDRQERRFNRIEFGSIDKEDRQEASINKAKWQKRKEDLSDTIHDLITNKRPPITIDEFPFKNKNEINNIFNNSPKSMKTFLLKNKNNFKFKNIETRKTSRFNSFFKNIKVNLKKDAKDGYRTTFHEISHNLDYILKRPSQDGVFKELLIEDFNRIKNAYMVKYNLSEKETYARISKALKQNKKLNSVSDIVGGITNNMCVGRAKHRTEYWKGAYKLEREAFAHFGSAYIRKDIEEIEYISQMFPNASEHFNNYFRK